MIPENTWCQIHNKIFDGFECHDCKEKRETFCQKHQYSIGDYDFESATFSSPECPWCEKEKIDQTIGYTADIQGKDKSLVLERPKTHIMEKIMKQRKYLPTLAELLDRLIISQTKELKIPEHREEYTQEINDIVHDIQFIIDDSSDKAGGKLIDANMLRDVIILSLINREIWINEENARKGNKEGNNLELSHGLNGIRNAAKNKIQERLGGRSDHKIDNVQVAKQWIPSGYSKPEDEDEYPPCENCGLEIHPNLPCEEVGGVDKRKKRKK